MPNVVTFLWWCILPIAWAQGQIFIPGPLSVSNDNVTAIVASNQTCNALAQFYDKASLGCNECVTANGATNISNPWLIPDDRSSKVAGLPTSCTFVLLSGLHARKASVLQAGLLRAVSKIAPNVQCIKSRRTTPLGAWHVAAPHSVSKTRRGNNGSYLAAKECVICASNTIADEVSKSCQPCPDPAMIAVETADGYTCSCPNKYHEVASTSMGVHKCVLQTQINLISAKIMLSTANIISYSSFPKDEVSSSSSEVSLASAVLDDIFLPAVTSCYFYQSERELVSCQALGNLCVLQHFDPAVPSCVAFDIIQRGGRVSITNGINGWFDTLPFLNYRSQASSVLETHVAMKMSFDKASNPGTVDHLTFVIASYYANGTLIGFHTLTNELAYCQASAKAGLGDLPIWERFGVNVLSDYTCDLTGLKSSVLTLHELFLVDQSKSDGEDSRYVPVPVHNLNYRDTSGTLVNQNSRPTDTGNDFLSHRFFLYDTQSGIPVGETSPKVIRYAKSVTLTITTQNSDSQLIYVPLLSLAYEDTMTPRSVSLSFRVVYTSNTDNFWSFTTALFSVVCTLGGFRGLLQTFNWQRRNNRNELVPNAMCQWISAMTSYSISNFAIASFATMFLLCGYFFVIYRLQSGTVLMVPVVNFGAFAAGVDEYYPFRVVLPLTFFCQLFSVLSHVYHQAQLQLFFVDWEKPRATIIDIDTAKPTHAPISAWRMILVVNEWNKLQTVRKTSLPFTIVFVLFLLYGCDLKLSALPVPRDQMKYVTSSSAVADTDFQPNPCLRFANIAVWWLAVWVGQRIWKWMVYERYFDEPREHLFIDLCTVAKVSCFFLDEQYHGFYLHCRSPHPFADGSMGELVDQLKQEEAGLTAGRHLDSTLPNCQAFEIFVTRKWKRKFHSLYIAVQGDSTLNGRVGSGEGLIHRSFSPKGPPTRPLKNVELKRHNGMGATEDMVQSAGQLRDFLQAFVENQNDRFRWRIYRAHTWLTRFLDLPPDMSISRQSLFVPDTDSRFAKAALLLGIENELMLLDLLCFCLLDLWIGNHAVSGLVTYGLYTMLVSIRARVGSRNIAKSTLVDSRFLI